MAVMENNLSVPIYSTNGLWLRRGSNLPVAAESSQASVGLKLETAHHPAPRVSITHLSRTQSELETESGEREREAELESRVLRPDTRR